MEELRLEDLELVFLLKGFEATADAVSDFWYDCCVGGADTVTSGVKGTGAAALRAFAASESRLGMGGRSGKVDESPLFGMSDARYKALPDMIRHR